MDEKLKQEVLQNDNDMQKFLSRIKEKCPVNVYNYDTNEHAKLIIAGKYLMCQNQVKLRELFNKYALDSEVRDGSILFFDRHHITEVITVICGALDFPLINMPDDMYRERNILPIAEYLSTPHMYCDFMDYMMNFIKSLQERLRFDDKILERLRVIFIKIWFMPYSSLDAVTKLAIEEYKKEVEGDANG